MTNLNAKGHCQVLLSVNAYRSQMPARRPLQALLPHSTTGGICSGCSGRPCCKTPRSETNSVTASNSPVFVHISTPTASAIQAPEDDASTNEVRVAMRCRAVRPTKEKANERTSVMMSTIARMISRPVLALMCREVEQSKVKQTAP